MIEKEKKYILMHKNIKVLCFCVNEKNFIIRQIFEEKHMPPFLFNYKKEKKELLKEWIISRIIPNTRTKYDRLSIGEEKLKTEEGKIELSLMNKCLTLSDCYWVSEEENEKWERVNFYDNNFNDFLNEYFLNTPSYSPQIIEYQKEKKSSPSLGTQGNLAKAWIIKDKKRILLKNGHNSNFGENYIEVKVSNILDDCNIKHVKYWLENNKNHKYSACECFCSKDIEFIPMEEYRFLYDNWTTYDMEYILDKMSFKEDFIKMLFVDYVLCNKDRHWYNFGIIRNPDTLEDIQFAPIFDNGECLYNNDELNIGETIFSSTIGVDSRELLKYIQDDRFKNIIEKIIPKMRKAIEKHISYSEDLKNYCLKLLNNI